jgi:cytochrome c oxidase assembly factor CtaG
MPEGVLQALFPLAVAALYARRCRVLRRRGASVPRGRRGLFAAGLAIVLVAVEPPLDGLDDTFLSVHMAQHMLLGDLGPLLIVLGLTGPVMAPVLRLPGVRRLRALAHPAIALPLWAVDLYVWHLPVAYQAAVAHIGIHVGEHGCFMAFGMLMWMPLLGPLPVPDWFAGVARLLYVLGARAAAMLLAALFLFAGSEIYPHYGHSAPAHGLSAATDQHLAGAIMMGECAVVTLLLFTWLFLDVLRRMEERQRLLDYASAHGVALSDARAARAAAAGAGERLYARLAAQADTSERPAASRLAD